MTSKDWCPQTEAKEAAFHTACPLDAGSPKSFSLLTHTAKTNSENSKQIFQEKELHGHSPNFHIQVSVSDLYIPTIDLPILLQEKYGDRFCEYINRSQIHECVNWD